MLKCKSQVIKSLKVNNYFHYCAQVSTLSVNYKLDNFFSSDRIRSSSSAHILGDTMTSNLPSVEFPKWGLLPKKETGVLNVLNKYPDFDGRGVTIAIFDSGVDPGAAGLQITSDGKPKVIERFDCGGAGDVDTSTVVKADENNTIIGLSGKKLQIPSTWKNPSGEYHIGLKNAYDFYHKSVQERLQKERKEKFWDAYHKTAQAEAIKKLTKFKLLESKTNSASREEKLLKEDADGMNEALNILEKKYHGYDLGPAYDVVVFYNGEYWCACLDTSEKGDLNSCNVLGEYSITHDYKPMTASDQLNYSINVYEDGNLLEVVGICSSHGTHVASIAAGFFPNEPEKNGVAPGAQIISLSIGDHRLSTMETGSAITRAMIKIMQRNPPVDIINMSYGERSHWAHDGRLGDLMNEVVDKYGVVWICSAGNRGPALCTVGTPPDINSNNIIGIGAYVSPEMMDAEYSLRERMPGTVYTWSSRGPTVDGSKGVTVVAPGGAITSVPCYTLRGTQHMNGTSMSAPHTSGAIAVIMSSLKQRNISYTPYSIRRALENTAQVIDGVEVYAQGYGLLQVEKAIEWLEKYHDAIESKLRFHVTCGHNHTKGIHVRTDDLQVPKEYSVNVQPVFADSDNMDPEEKIKFQMSLSLTCSSSWVQIPPHLELMNMSRQFSVKIDPTHLSSGVHNTTILAFDSKIPEKGHVFSVEVTVVKPIVIKSNPHVKPELTFKDVDFKANSIKHHFVLVPKEATVAVLKLQANNLDTEGRFIIHCTQLKSKLCHAIEVYKVVTVNAQSEQIVQFQVYGDRILEVTIAKYWTNLGGISINYNLTFRGCKPSSETLNLYHHEGIQRVELHGGVQIEELSPNIQLKHAVSVLKPQEHKILPLSVRDVIPPSRQIYELVLTYSFHLNKGTEVMPFNPSLCELLYESPFESQMWMLHDSQKRLLAVGDAYRSKYTVKLDKGDYTIRHQIRHERKDFLEKMTEVPLVVSQKLANNISVDAYTCMCQALTNGKKANSTTVRPGNSILPIFIASLSQDKLKSITGQYLTGTVTYLKDETLKKVDVYPVKYYLSDSSKKAMSSSSSNNSNNTNNKSEQKEKSKEEEYEESVRDYKISWLCKLDNGEMAYKLYEELKGSYPQHVMIYSAMLQNIEPESKKLLPGFDRSEYKVNVDLEICEVADAALEAIDQTELLAYLGTKHDLRPDASKVKQQMDRQKAVIVDALSRKGAALCRISEDLKDANEKALENIDALYVNLQKFVEPLDSKSSVYFAVWHAAKFKHYGRLMKYLLKQLEEKPSKELIECLRWATQEAKLEHCAHSLNALVPIFFPSSYRPF